MTRLMSKTMLNTGISVSLTRAIENRGEFVQIQIPLMVTGFARFSN